MFNAFQEHIKNQFPELLQDTFVLGCSGGIDSVVLAHLCARLRMDFVLAHCNYQLRAEESDGDETFVDDLGKKLDKEVFVKRFNTDTYAEKNKLSIQLAARELRYRWFHEISKQESKKYILTAHHLDDNLETFLINLSRGTGIKGLTGIPERSGKIRRPLLVFSRDQILHYARDNNLKWREDSSNKELYYLRNRIRHQIVPELKELHPTFEQNFLDTLLHLKGSLSILEQQKKVLKAELFKKDGAFWRISVDQLKALDPLKPYLYLLFEEYGFREWDNVMDLLSASNSKQILSKTHRLVRDRTELLLSPLAPSGQESFHFSLDTMQLKHPVAIKIEPVDRIEETSKSILYVDKETLNNRLEVRKWKKGDYFYPLGMKGKKLLSKYFKDEKFNALEKESQWLLFSGDNLVWVIGHRADERFKVRPDSNSILRFSLIE